MRAMRVPFARFTSLSAGLRRPAAWNWTGHKMWRLANAIVPAWSR